MGTPESTHFIADVAAGSTDLVAAEGAGNVTVTGKVTTSEGKIPSGAIEFRVHSLFRSYSANLDRAGQFTVQLPPGAKYEVLGQIPNMYLAQIASQSGPLEGRVLEVKAGSAPRLEMVAASGYAQMEGTVQRGGQPASGVMVLLAPEDNQILFRRDQSDSDGTFSLGYIVPGRYRLLAVERGWELEWANRSVLDAFFKKGIPIEIHGGDKLNRTVEMQSR